MHELLAHSGHQEHLVVHREPEHHADEEDRQEGDDRLRVGDQSQPALLEDRHGDAEGRQDREDESEGADERDPERPEDADHDQECETDDHDQVGDECIVEFLGEIGHDGCLTADVEFRAPVLDRWCKGADLLHEVVCGG